MFDQILKALGGGNLADLETNAKDLLSRLEKLGGDVLHSNGNLVSVLVNLGSDFATLKAAVTDVRAIVDDLVALKAGIVGTPVVLVPASAPSAGLPSAVAVAATPNPAPAPVSAVSVLSAAIHVAEAVAQQTAAVLDPFAAKPLAHVTPASVITEPHGGA